MCKNYRNNRCQENPKIRIKYQKTKNKENPELHKNTKNEVSQMLGKQEK